MRSMGNTGSGKAIYLKQAVQNKRSMSVLTRRYQLIAKNMTADSCLADEMLALAIMLEQEAKIAAANGSDGSAQNLSYAAGYIRAHF